MAPTGATAYLDRIAQHVRGEIDDGMGHGRGKHQGLSLRGKLGDDFPDIVDEAHIEHAVGLVENETFNVVQAERIALDEIEQPAGRGDQDIDAIEQRANLAAHRHAADRQRAFDA